MGFLQIDSFSGFGMDVLGRRFYAVTGAFWRRVVPGIGAGDGGGGLVSVVLGGGDGGGRWGC